MDEEFRFCVRRDDPAITTLLRDPDAPSQRALKAGEVRLRVSFFAVTANNLTCALYGDKLSFWGMFPVNDPAWGAIPGWGVGEVVESRCDGITVGERLFGFLPMGSHLIVQPGAVSGQGFFDTAAPRTDTAPILHYFLRWHCRPQPAAVDDGLFALFYPLFGVGYLLVDYVVSSGADAASPLLITAASSKTATCAAFCLRRAMPAADLCGLTSAAHLDFVKSLGCYDRVVVYEHAGVGLRRESVTLIDIAGDARLRDAIHQHYGERLRTSISVGRAHWAEFKPPYASLPGPRPKQFWAPHYGRVRVSSSGTGISSEQYNAGLSRAWRDFTSAVLARPRQQPFATLNLSGPGGIAVAWAALLDGSADPHEGFVVQL